MNKTLAVLAFLLLPSISSAAPLTQDQATSLISVVQSSPQTPANAFVSLITAFSNITVPQAESLISVVQASPGTPANAFINFLIAFTVDSQPVQLPVVSPPVVTPAPVTPSPVAPPILGNTNPSVNNPQPTPTPVVESKSMDTTLLDWNEFYVDGNILKITTNKLIDFSKTTFTQGITINKILVDGADAGMQGFGPLENRQQHQAYHYEATLSGNDSPNVTIQDMNDSSHSRLNEGTMYVVVHNAP